MLELVGAIYEAAYDQRKWTDYLRLLKAQTGAASACLLGFDFDPTGGGGQFGEMLDAPEDSYRAYEAHYWQLDSFALADRRYGFATGQVWNSADCIPDAAMAAGEYCNDFLRPLDIFYFAGGVPIRTGTRFVWSGALHSRAHGPADSATMRLLETLMPHLQQALQIDGRLRQLQAGRALGGSLIDGLPYGIVALDGRGRVLSLNRIAASILAARDGLRLGQGGLSGLRPQDDEPLRAAFARACAATPAASTLTLPRPAHTTPLRVVVGPVPRGATLPFADPAPTVLLFLHDATRLPAPPERLLRQLYGLTAQEARLAALLAAGSDLAEAADSLGIARKTATGYLGQVFRKTGMRRQAELARLLAALPVVDGLDSQSD